MIIIYLNENDNNGSIMEKQLKVYILISFKSRLRYLKVEYKHEVHK